MNPNDNGYLTAAEFERAMKALERAVSTGFERTDSRLENIEAAMTPLAERVAVLEASKKKQVRQVSWTAAAAAAVTVVIETVRRSFLGS